MSKGVKICGVYLMCSKSNNLVYVGAARDVIDRWCNHLYALRRGDHAYSKTFLKSYKNGTLALFLLERCSIADLPKREQHWMDKFPERVNKYRYSTPIGNKNSAGKKLTAAHIEAIRQSWLGKHHTKEAKAKISAATKGHTVSPEARKKISASAIGNKRWLGRKHTPETIEKMSKAHAGHVDSLATREKKRKARLGWKHSEETRKKIGEGNSRRVYTPEMIERIKKAQQLRWEKYRSSKTTHSNCPRKL